ncbi:MAG: protein kinase [Polyangiaceae bacterium]
MTTTETLRDRAEARVGTVLRGKWRLDAVLGVGGMASVYSATHRNQARVAIKLMHPEIAAEAEVTERFRREGYLGNVVDHPGTAKVLDDDVTEDGSPFLVMELLEGETVEERSTRKDRTLPVSEVVAVADKALDVLAAAHDKGVVHRDLKPENLFLTVQGELKILDFGIARMREVAPESHTRTRVGALLGTPAYMAPEQARGRWDDVDARTDIWALGATLFTLLAGRFVHEGSTVQEQLILAGSARAPSLATVAPAAPVWLVQLVDRALSFEKAARWPDARTMQAWLRQHITGDKEPERLSLPVPSVLRSNVFVMRRSSSHSDTELAETTARPVAEDISSIPPPAQRRTRALRGGGGWALGVAAGVLWWRASDPPIASGPVPEATVRVAGPAIAATVAPVVEKPAEPPVRDKPAEPASAAADPSRPTPPGGHPVGPRSRPSGDKPGADKPGEARPASTGAPVAPPASANPFDRRF